MTLHELNTLPKQQLKEELMKCCGSSAWARSMAAARPFATLDAMVIAGDAIWRALAPADWLEAFAAHPKIGEQGSGSPWSTREQSGMQAATDDVRRRLASGNTAFLSRFGYIFIICATGKTAADLLRALEARLSNDPAVELRVAAEEQRKITGLRLARLMDGHS